MLFICVVLTLIFSTIVAGSPTVPTPTRRGNELIEMRTPTRVLVERTDPTFPASPPSCPICEQSYPSISSCAQAAPVLANFSQIIFDPGAFISIIECSCTDTFKSAFPQCVDCFQQTNQTDVITSEAVDLPSVLMGLRSVCALASTLLGNVTGTNGEQVNGTPVTVPPASASSSAMSARLAVLVSSGMALTVAFLGTTLTL